MGEEADLRCYVPGWYVALYVFALGWLGLFGVVFVVTALTSANAGLALFAAMWLLLVGAMAYLYLARMAVDVRVGATDLRWKAPLIAAALEERVPGFTARFDALGRLSLSLPLVPGYRIEAAGRVLIKRPGRTPHANVLVRPSTAQPSTRKSAAS